MSKQRDNSKALATFLGNKAEIDEALAKLQALSNEHFNVAPEDVNWGHVGDLDRSLVNILEAYVWLNFKA